MPSKPAASKPANRASKDLAVVAATGDRLATLEALRDRLAAKLDAYQEPRDTPRDMAVLALRLTDVLAQIDGRPTSRQVSRADEIAERRAARRAGDTTNKTRAARPG